MVTLASMTLLLTSVAKLAEAQEARLDSNSRGERFSRRSAHTSGR
jgi:hypothetical protein